MIFLHTVDVINLHVHVLVDKQESFSKFSVSTQAPAISYTPTTALRKFQRYVCSSCSPGLTSLTGDTDCLAMTNTELAASAKEDPEQKENTNYSINMSTLKYVNSVELH